MVLKVILHLGSPARCIYSTLSGPHLGNKHPYKIGNGYDGAYAANYSQKNYKRQR